MQVATAIGQQCLSIIASDNGRFTRIADLCTLFELHNYIQRHLVESICAELGNNNYLQKHGFKNQYGADNNLYRLVDYRLIYGNFGSGSRTVEIRYGSKVLGEVPADNLLRLRKGVLVRFSAKIWRINKISMEAINVEPTQVKGSIIDFTYSGGGIDSDAFICNRMWQLIYSKKLPVDILCLRLQKVIEQTVNSLRRVCSYEQVPYNRQLGGIRYFTFAGYLVNKAIALITNQLDYKADDISLLVNLPINWQSIPINPEAYEPIFHLLFEVSSQQSIYQALLPSELQLREFIQDWLRDETIVHALVRLNNSTPVEIRQLNVLTEP